MQVFHLSRALYVYNTISTTVSSSLTKTFAFDTWAHTCTHITQLFKGVGHNDIQHNKTQHNGFVCDSQHNNNL
jgi:hypothetical protein